MLRIFRDKYPRLDAKAWVANEAAVIGEVTMKEYSSVWFNATVRGDINKIVIGAYSNIQDNAVVHVADEYGCLVGDYVTVGHGAILHACTIEDHCLIGMNATVLNGAVIGAGSIIAAGSVVTNGTIIPPRSLVVGVPGKVRSQVSAQQYDNILAQAIKYKTLWAEWYNILPDNDGKKYDGHQII